MYISKGNLKLGKGFLVWSLPCRATCPGKTAMCSKYCYAWKAERMYPNVVDSRLQNFDDTREWTFEAEMTANIKRLNKKGIYKYFRIHESGDFYSEEYFIKWLNIVKRFPDIKFLAFTKSKFVKKYVDQLPDNFHIYFSVWADTNLEDIVWDLPMAFAGDYRHILDKDVFQCTGKCEECLHCFNKKQDLHFNIH